MSRIEELKKEIEASKAITEKLQKELEREKQKTKIEFPSLKMHEHYWLINNDGEVFCSWWSADVLDVGRYEIGNVFHTQEEAEKERDRCILLTRFRQFRDKCNGDWKPNFKDENSWKHYINFNHQQNRMKIYPCWNLKEFNLFGYFKNESDAARAIELFGDEIKRLFVEEEK